jgi:pullulanase
MSNVKGNADFLPGVSRRAVARQQTGGIGLPIASQNQPQWTIMTPLLSDSAYTSLPANIAYTQAAFGELLNIRYSSELFRMATFEEVQRNLSFLNTGPNQTPGLIVTKLDANGGNYGIYKHIVVVFKRNQ